MLTIITQIGGLILVISIPLFFWTKKRFTKKRWIVNITIFLSLYLSATFLVVPILAKSFGRVPLPIFGNNELKPLNILTCVLNRHYVRPELKNNIENSATLMQKEFPGTIVSYLDANFPFYNGFPLLPHLSHSDGKKLDLAFFYSDKDGKPINNITPSFIGYGVFEEPKLDETDMPKNCKEKGFWQYSLLEKFVPQWNKYKMPFDEVRTKYFISLLINQSSTNKIFIEPHLKTRMNLNSNRVRFHGCRAVRHDDHIHLQIK